MVGTNAYPDGPGWELGPIKNTNWGDWPRVSYPAYTASITITLVLAVGVTAYRTFFRLRYFKKLYLDDYFLFYVVAATITGNVLALWFQKGLWWRDIYALGGLDRPIPPSEFAEMALWYLEMNHILTTILYSAVFTVKLSYLVFFRKLIGRVRALEIWWWIVLAILVPAGLAATFLPWWVCPAIHVEDFPSMSPTLATGHVARYLACGEADAVRSNVSHVHPRIQVCDLRPHQRRARYSHRSPWYFPFSPPNPLHDVLTSSLVISIPLHLLFHVKMDWHRKVVVASILCLSIVMILSMSNFPSLYCLMFLSGLEWKGGKVLAHNFETGFEPTPSLLGFT